MIHPCKCTDYNGGQCYNCLNGCHSICAAGKRCRTRNSKVPGLLLVFKKAKRR
jgi:hypothetical protein